MVKILEIKSVCGFIDITYNVHGNYNNHGVLIPVSSDRIDKIKAMSADELVEKYIFNYRTHAA